jgi:hypothetical protein
VKETIVLFLGLASLFGSNQQNIDLGIDRWTVHRFFNDAQALVVKVPPGYMTFTPEVSRVDFKGRSRFDLLDVQYDYGNPKSSDLPEFKVHVALQRLKTPVDPKSVNVETLDRVLENTMGRPLHTQAGPFPVLEQVGGRIWIFYDNSQNDTLGFTRDVFGTLVDDRTILFFTGWYWQNIRKDPKWLLTRRHLLRTIRDNVEIIDQ